MCTVVHVKSLSRVCTNIHVLISKPKVSDCLDFVKVAKHTFMFPAKLVQFLSFFVVVFRADVLFKRFIIYRTLSYV